MASQNSRNAPGRSGMVTAKMASRASPSSARSATNRSRSKSMFAPLSTAQSRASRIPVRSTQAARPATASAPAGSMIERVSSNTSLMAAQISSFDTSTISSTVWRASAKVCSPTSRTATPSAKMPT